MATQQEDSSLGDLLAQLVLEMNTLIQRELDLARVEMSQKGAQMARGAGLLAVGGALAYAGLLALLAAGITALVQYAGLTVWEAALAVGAAALVVGLFMTMRGRHALRIQSLAPRKTLQTLKDNAEWATKRGGR